VIAPRLSRFKGRAPPYYVEVPELHRRALSSGLIACDAIARVKQAALVCREAEHASKLGTPTQMSNISISHLRNLPCNRYTPSGNVCRAQKTRAKLQPVGSSRS
jgi:hypothetical protein